ncbi:Mob1/phocein [Teratosphaeria nubilosa]|uniref:Mob1/phocein n=1 Tax=Teratosphaeria nubilosa TaxID=161662 RepID=A0A6G1LNT2_9PEZI|nr:Mob1/phocein [Teratosphaeria nubilosa]
MATHSPSSSPRLPSPPPIAEDQTMPTSPGVSLFEDHGKFPGATLVEIGASRRIRPGTKAEDMAEGPPLVELGDIESPFPLTEHLKSLHYHHTHPDSNTIAPITAEIARQFSSPPPNTSREIWLYELGRFLIQKTNAIIVALFSDDPPCSAQTCPEMRASEWQYLCAVHDPPKSCAAIDYCCHTLDNAATVLCSSKMFPSRLALGSGVGGGQQPGDRTLAAQMKEITNIFRRVYRIYAHAWFQHREMFWRVESKTGLYVFFKNVCDEYGIIQAENYTIPPEAEGLEPQPGDETATSPQGPTVLKRDDRGNDGPEEMGNHIVAAGDTTKRHRHTMSSDRSSSVSTVIQEESEEEEAAEAAKTARQAEEMEMAEPPSLERQATSLKDFAESLPQPGQVKTDNTSEEATKIGEQSTAEVESQVQEPMVGIARQNTMKPLKEEGGGQVDGAEGEDRTEVTVIEAEVDPNVDRQTEVEAKEEGVAEAAGEKVEVPTA